MISSCTSTIAVGTAYNSAASRFSNTLQEYADFNNDQKKAIKQRVAAFHQWHRENQLAEYRGVMQQLSTMLSDSQVIRKSDVIGLTATAQALIQQLSRCSPLNGSGGFLQTLSNRQVKQIAANIRDKHAERVREYKSESAAERLENRQKNLKKWAKRAGVKMTDEQSQLLAATLQRQISLSPQRHELWQAWSGQLIDQLNNRRTRRFVVQIDKHIDSLWQLTATAYPEEWQSNLALWQEFLFSFIQLMTDQQKKKLSGTIEKLSDTLLKLANEPAKTNAVCFASVPQ